MVFQFLLFISRRLLYFYTQLLCFMSFFIDQVISSLSFYKFLIFSSTSDFLIIPVQFFLNSFMSIVLESTVIFVSQIPLRGMGPCNFQYHEQFSQVSLSFISVAFSFFLVISPLYAGENHKFGLVASCFPREG